MQSIRVHLSFPFFFSFLMEQPTKPAARLSNPNIRRPIRNSIKDHRYPRTAFRGPPREKKRKEKKKEKGKRNESEKRGKRTP